MHVQARSAVLADVFYAFDLDASNGSLKHTVSGAESDTGGYVETSELMQLGVARQELGQKSRTWTPEKNEALLQSLDTDGDGKVSIQEFVDGFITQAPEELLELMCCGAPAFDRMRSI